MIFKSIIPLRPLFKGVIKMGKNLTFWSIILGFLVGYVFSSGDKLVEIASANISMINPNNTDLWKFIIWLIVLIPFAIIFVLLERRETSKTNHILEAIAKQLGVNPDDYKHRNKKPTK